MNALTKVEEDQFTRSCAVRKEEELKDEIRRYSDKYNISVEELEMLIENNKKTIPQH